MTLSQIAARTGGHLVGGDPESRVDGFDYDSRVQRAGAGFVALVGDRDGHAFVADALEAAGVDRILTMDLHAGQIQGFFTVPVDHMTALPLFARHFRDLGLHGGDECRHSVTNGRHRDTRAEVEKTITVDVNEDGALGAIDVDRKALR